MARKALGRGLGALISEKKTEVETKEKVSDLNLGVEEIKPNSNQPRSYFDEEALEELSQSIKENGIVQPIVVREKGKGYEIVAGERRWRAAQKAGLKNVPAVIREIEDDKMLELALIENIQREELNPVEESIAYQKLIEQLGLTQNEVAERVGKTRTFIANYLRLLNLPKPVLKKVESNELSVGHAKAILSLDSPKDQKELANLILTKKLSVREAEKAAKKPKKAKSKKKKDSKDPNIAKAETKLRRRFGTQVRIKPDPTGKSGKIELEYFGTEDLDRIYNLLLNK